MNNEARDQLIIEIHTAVTVVAEKVEDHHETLYGSGNNNPGLAKTVTLLQERQNQCPARRANTTEGKRLSIATITLVLAILVTIFNVISRWISG